ncbi:Mom family adenine methylcarbamoylation protein [Paenibacillus oceani]
MKLELCTTTELDKWIAERHYLQSSPAGARLRLWVLDDGGRRIGAMMWGRPTARSLDRENILELTRMYLIDDTEGFAESKALAMARKHIRKNYPKIKGLLAYSSTGEGHEGKIYEADNWFPLGLTKKRSSGWTSRDARLDRDLSQKIRWVRSP